MTRWMLLLGALGAGPAWAGEPEWIAARIEKIDAARGVVTLAHGPIKSVGMAAMTMPFKVAEPADLRARQVGERVRFTIVMRDDEIRVARIEPAP